MYLPMHTTSDLYMKDWYNQYAFRKQQESSDMILTESLTHITHLGTLIIRLESSDIINIPHNTDVFRGETSNWSSHICRN